MSKEIRLSIPAMKCDGCVTSVRKAIQDATSDEIGVARVIVDLETKTASVETDIAAPVLIDALKSAGFDATEVAVDSKNKPT
jgi:copper chaperone CopZ